MVQRGFSMTTGITFILVFSVSNFIATPLGGWIADRVGYKRVLAAYLPVLFAAISLMGVVQSPMAALVCMFFAGFAVLGSTCLMLPYAGSLFEMKVRSTAMGVIYAISRVGTIIGPAIAGVMLAAHMSVATILVAIAAPSIVALIAILMVRDVEPTGESPTDDLPVIESQRA
jgi:AAHS family benzoate transporter-like MFS transporter